jgi:hypothetical protein
LSTTNPTWPDPGLKPGHRGEKPGTNRFSYGAASRRITAWAAARPSWTETKMGSAITISFPYGPMFRGTGLEGRCGIWILLITCAMKLKSYGKDSDTWIMTRPSVIYTCRMLSHTYLFHSNPRLTHYRTRGAILNYDFNECEKFLKDSDV